MVKLISNGLTCLLIFKGGMMGTSKYLGISLILVVVLVLSSFIVLWRMNDTNNVTPGVTSDNLLQYEWPQPQGDSSFNRFSAGPAPQTPESLWAANVSGIQSYLSAFNAKVFVTTKTTVIAMDKDTGDILWNTTVPAPGPWPEVYKIDNTHLVIGNSSLDIDTGKILWTSPIFSACPRPLFTLNVYSPEQKMFYTNDDSYVQAWDFSDPSNPPKLAWRTYVSGMGSDGSGIQYGDGKVFAGSYEPHQVALDAKTGKILWDTQTKGSMLFSGSYSDGKFFRGGTHDNTLYCFDANNGDILWTFNPKTSDGYFCVGTATAYGMVYSMNKDGFLYALNVTNGDVVWKYQGPSTLMFPGTPTVADGMVYATTGQTASYTEAAGESEFACLDAYTGAVIWKLPVEAFAPRESVAIAYGNLYMIPGSVTKAVDSISGEEYDTAGQVWAFGPQSWSTYRQNPAHLASAQSGPTNLTLLWNYTATGAVSSSPSIADNKVFFGSQDKNVYCIDAQNGSFIWKFPTGARIESSPAVSNGKVYIGPDDGNVYCLDDNDGSLIWKKSAGGYIEANFASLVRIQSSPTVIGGLVYVGSLDKNVYCFDAVNGDIIWTYKTLGYITSSPAVVNGALYITSQEPDAGALYKLDTATGDLVWKQSLPYFVTLGGGTDMHGSPVVANGMVIVSSNMGAYYAINTETGATEWTFSDDAARELIVCSPAYHNGQVFLIDKYSIVCVNAQNGQTLWSTFLNEELYVSPTYADGKLYVVTDQRSIYVLDATNGAKLSHFETSSNSWSAASLYDGKLYVGNNDWNVYCLTDSTATK
jgi:outer membrane protein assembly factor BamB